MTRNSISLADDSSSSVSLPPNKKIRKGSHTITPNTIPTQGQLCILYQSLEYPRCFTQCLTSFFQRNCNGNKYQFIANNDARSSEEYHKNVATLLKCYLENIKNELQPDIVALGEYKVSTEYPIKLAGYQDPISLEVKDGRRSMTIFVREKSLIERITLYNTSDPTVTQISVRTILAQQENTEARRKRLAEVVKERIGEFIELLYKNYYIALTHVSNGKNGDTPEARLATAGNTSPALFFVGDLNLGIASDKHEINKQLTGSQKFMANTNVSDLFKGQNKEYLQLQLDVNEAGKTTYSSAHDGVVVHPHDCSPEFQNCGSLWPIIFTNKKEEVMVMGDHRGFLTKLVITSYKDTSASDDEAKSC